MRQKFSNYLRIIRRWKRFSDLHYPYHRIIHPFRWSRSVRERNNQTRQINDHGTRRVHNGGIPSITGINVVVVHAILIWIIRIRIILVAGQLLRISRITGLLSRVNGIIGVAGLAGIRGIIRLSRHRHFVVRWIRRVS